MTKFKLRVVAKRMEVINFLKQEPMALRDLSKKVSFSHSALRTILKLLCDHNVLVLVRSQNNLPIYKLNPETEWSMDVTYVEERRCRLKQEPVKPTAYKVDSQNRVKCYGIWGLA